MKKKSILYAVCVPFLVGACFVTTECGDELAPIWTPQTSGTGVSLRGVCAVSADVAWASGAGGTCLRTVDGGKTWNACPVPSASSLDFRDVEAFDDQTAILLSAGSPAKIFKTRDGGVTWTQQYSNETPGIFFDGLAFWNEKSGLAFSDPVDGCFILIETHDGGDTWNRIPPENLPRPLDGEAGFAASGTCVAVAGDSHAWFATGGAAARVCRSSTKGITWSAVTTPILSGAPSTGIFSIAFKDERHGVIVGGDYEDEVNRERIAAWTDDGGAVWNLVKESNPGGYRSCVACVSVKGQELFIAVGPGGSDLSRDGGRSWMPLCDIGWHSISFAGACGWATGSDGRIAKVEF